jgi:HD-like signal output (HDOD) protein
MSTTSQPPPPNEEQSATESSTANGTPAQKIRSPFERTLSPHALVWSEASRLAVRKDVKVSDIALCALQDPAIILELLKRANALYFSAGRPPITNAETAITRLGSDVVAEILAQLFEREPIEDLEVRKIFEFHRNRCKRAGILAHMLAEVISKTLAEECHTAGLFLFVGDMLAVQHLGKPYVDLYNSQNFISVQCKLTQDHKFDPEKMGLNYLQKNGVPDLVLTAINRNTANKNPERAVMKPICFAAAEMVDHFDNNKWDKLAPGKQLPPKSALRFLQIHGGTYIRLFERATEYLYLDKAQQERTSIEELGRPKPVEVERPSTEAASTQPDEQESISFGDSSAASDLEAELQELLDSTPPPPPPERTGPGGRVPPPPRRGPPPPRHSSRKEAAPSSPPPLDRNQIIEKSYNLGAKDPNELGARRKQTTPIAPPAPLRTSSGNAFVTNVTDQIEHAKRSEDLLRDILSILTDEGPFEKTALMVVSKDRKTAIVIAARGPQIATGQQLLLDDPLSPLAQCFSKVQSFGNRASSESPWGSKAFALAPIDANHETPVALYADCGINGSITFEARRIFRVVVDILNQKLPTLPGGLPVEL